MGYHTLQYLITSHVVIQLYTKWKVYIEPFPFMWLEHPHPLEVSVPLYASHREEGTQIRFKELDHPNYSPQVVFRYADIFDFICSGFEICQISAISAPEQLK